MCGPQIRLCLFTIRPIASKQLNILTKIDILRWLGGAVVTHPLWVQEDPGLIVVVVFLLFVQTHYLSHNLQFLFALLIYLVYFTYSKICDRLWVYKDTDLASLSTLYHYNNMNSWYILNESHWSLM